MKKIIVVGLGNVGFTYVTISVARGLQAEWIFVDKNQEVADAHAHDFQDMVALMPRNNSTFRTGTLADAKGADVVVIAASIPADKTFADRLALAGANAKLMGDFGQQLKDAGFKGVVIVPANPCDVMAAAVHYASGLPFKKVISTGTLLDSARFKKIIAQRFNVSADSVIGSILAEHGASAMANWSQVKVGDADIATLIKTKRISANELDEILEKTVKEGFYIFSRKGNTQFGIATSIFEITDAVINNKRQVMNVGVKLPGGYKNAGIYSSIPVIVGENGYEYLPSKPTMTKEEWAKFEESTAKLAKVHEDTLDKIGIKVKFD
ncbi:L-lactate dehydrogenase [Mycoplasma sp. Mirounga ES2805-ORL]|uniref:lactate/malate family dehydrogenase n=1 Tax=Mycoplasma sp. Mirounga ES2805-ORL TaxID=754514 RepID=UPI00197BC198|nr:L-lactate dehydrogenase [Mycoplasma sp. Mirounga ES2805-ORL]QSF13745.1 L-lactate dehydrogenase [Mycoplasma sp. Mirounga ES2805-ORL]